MMIKKNSAVTSIQASFTGFYSIQGIALKQGVVYKNCDVRLHEKSTGMLVNRTITKEDGSYAFRNLKKCEFILIATDYARNFNAVIQDNVVPK